MFLSTGRAPSFGVSFGDYQLVTMPHILMLILIRGRCYDHNVRRFFPIFGEKIGVFLKNQCYDQLFSKFSFVLSQKRQFFRKNFRRKYLKNHNIGPLSPFIAEG
jgi:hypothetical protein